MFKYMKDEEWDILIPIILILIICVFVLNHYAEENAAEKTSPDVGVMFSDREFGIAPYIMGCDWTDEKDGHREKIPYDVSSKYLILSLCMTFLIRHSSSSPCGLSIIIL